VLAVTKQAPSRCDPLECLAACAGAASLFFQTPQPLNRHSTGNPAVSRRRCQKLSYESCCFTVNIHGMGQRRLHQHFSEIYPLGLMWMQK
jgi:hypothetical protein